MSEKRNLDNEEMNKVSGGMVVKPMIGMTSNIELLNDDDDDDDNGKDKPGGNPPTSRTKNSGNDLVFF